MEEQELRNIVVATGPELLREGLVARTWGNISARVDDTHYLITPSGMDYEQLTADCYFEGSYKKALQALTLNRTLVDAQKARAVLNDLIDANQRYWPELK